MELTASALSTLLPAAPLNCQISALRSVLAAQRDLLVDPYAALATGSDGAGAGRTLQPKLEPASAKPPTESSGGPLGVSSPADQKAEPVTPAAAALPHRKPWGLNVLDSEMEQMERELARREERAR